MSMTKKYHDPDPHPDPLVRGMDPRIQIRIRIHTKMSWIRNTAKIFSGVGIALFVRVQGGVHSVSLLSSVVIMIAES
jgi:hypothetical protein